VTPRLKIINVVEPPKRAAGEIVADAASLVDKLRNEVKII
jgi:electron transfer flavoprotein alpha/beta subunit